MKREIMTTGDGSKTIHMPDLNEQYHSKHGALQEARHVFIETGLRYFKKEIHTDDTPIRILEYGFGTGFNAMLTAQVQTNDPIHYTAIEAYPVNDVEIEAMEYGQLLGDQSLYNKLHQAPWENEVPINSAFTLVKKQTTFETFSATDDFDLIFFDAFGPRTQPELWTAAIFDAAYKALKTPGVLVTYCAAGQVRRNMQQAGFIVERLPGPPGKREMLRAVKK